MRRGLSSLFVAAVMLASSVAPSAAEDAVRMRGSGGGLSGVITRSETVPGRAAPAAQPVVNTQPATSGVAAPQPRVVRRPNGWIYDYRDLGGGRVRYVFEEGPDHCTGGYRETVCYGPAPEPRRPGETREEARERRRPIPPPISPQEIVERTIVNVQLPEPRPRIAPGHAITGLRAYLETGSATTHRFDPIRTVLGPLSISATSTYTVDWGDGTTTGPHETSGGAYPDGDITHVYQRTATVDVTVTQHWTAQWSLAGQSGTVTGLVSSGTIEDFRIREVQAVRRR